ncbi:hypothetical protein GN956_G10407 [Arapaima gigas]
MAVCDNIYSQILSQVGMDPVTQSDFNGEESSGTDVASLQSISIPATETDRFGFLLRSGSTIGSGPPPEVVRQRETKWLNIMSQWDRMLIKKTNKVKDQCRKGIPASLRARCWPLLCRATERKSRNADLYERLEAAPALQSWVDVIERDIDRQFPFHEMFLSKDGHGQRGLFRVLKAYTQFRPDEGYCQGQGPVAAVLLMIMPAEEAFWCLVQISEQYLPGYYSPLLEGVIFDAGILDRVLRKACPAASKHLKKHGVEPLMFATGWLMCLYTRHLPFNTLLRVWDLFFCYGVRVLFQVAVVLVRRCLGRQEQRDECEGQMETLERLRSIKDWISQEDDAFIEEVCSISLSGKDLERETEKEMEKWKTERPSSTFNPWGRCHGYRAAWVKGRERELEFERKEREKGNLSVPLARSPSSLSPSFLRKLRRGSKADMSEKEGSEGREEGKVKALVEEPEEKMDTESNKETHLSNDEDHGTQNILADDRKSLDEQRKPSKHSTELNQNATGHELNLCPINEGSSCENLKPHDISANSSHIVQSAANTEGNDLRGQTQDGPGHLAVQTLEKSTQVVEMTENTEHLSSFQTDSELNGITNLTHSEEDVKPTHNETVHTSCKPPVEYCHSDVPQHANQTSVQKSISQEQCEVAEKVDGRIVNEVEAQEPIHLHDEKQDTTTVEYSSGLDSCTQCTTNEQTENPEGLTPNQKEALDETEEWLVQEHSCSLEELNKDTADRSEETGELSTTENTIKKPACSVEVSTTLYCFSKEVQETKVFFPISDKIEVSLQMQSTLCECSQNTEQISSISSGVDLDEPSEEPELQDKQSEEYLPSNCLPVGIQVQEEKHSNDTTKGKALPVTADNSESLQDVLTECNSCTEKHLSEDLVASEATSLQGTTENLHLTDPYLTTQVYTTSQASDGETTGGNKQEYNPAFRSAAAAVPYENEPPDCLLTAVVSTQGDECKQFNSTNDENVKEAHKPTDLTEVEARDSIPCNESLELQQTHPLNQNEAQVLESEKSPEAASAASEKPVGSPRNQGSTVLQTGETQMNAGNIGDTSQPCHCAQPSEGTGHNDGEAQKDETKQVGDIKEDTRCFTEETLHKEISSTVPPVKCTPKEKDETQKDKFSSSTGIQHPLTITGEDGTKSLKMSDESQKSGVIAEYKLRKTSSSRTSHPRRLSENTFKEPQMESIQLSPCPEVFTDTNRDHKPSQSTGELTDSPKRFGLFRRLRGDHAKDSEGGAKSKTKMTVPTILIQDFSEQVEEPQDGLNAKERRKRRREQERRQKEEEKARKKREKELEKERNKERRKPQTRGKSFQVQSSSKGDNVIPTPRNSSSNIPISKRNSAPYFDTYF